MPVDFCVDMNAPDGLKDLDLQGCMMPLRTHTSGYNNKVILRQELFNENLEWEMASSDEEILLAEGTLNLPLDQVIMQLQSLSICLVRADIPHLMVIGDGNEQPAMRIEYRWVEPPTD